MYRDDGFKKRFWFFSFMLFLLFVFVVSNYVQKMVFSLGSFQPVRNFRIEYKRGNILDVNGNNLAVDTKFYDAYISTSKMDNDKKIEYAVILSKILSLDKEKLYKDFSGEQKYILLKRKLSIEELNAIEDYKSNDKLAYVGLEEYYDRIYPEKNLGSLYLGFTGKEKQGLEGIEYIQDSYLSPKNKIENSRMIKGYDVFLTIDLNLQKFSDDAMSNMVQIYDPESALIVIMKADTGELLSYSGYPNYDPNKFAEYPAESRRDILVSKVYEPGSTFKIFSVAIAYENGLINDNTLINTEGGYRVSDTEVIKDYSYRGITNPEGVIKYSSNIGAAYLSDTVDDAFFYDTLKKFGFGDLTGIELNGEERGILKSPKDATWSKRTKPTISFGQEVGVTAMQMISAATVFANGGNLLKPFIIKKIVDNSGKVVKSFEKEVIRKVISEGVAKKMLSHMRATAEGLGTGRRVKVEGYPTAVKTGTAQVANKSGYSEDRFLGSTIALFPGDDPKFIIYVFMDYPKGESLGGVTTSPVVKDLIEFLISYESMGRRVEKVKEDLSFFPNLENLPEIKEEMPSFIGLSKRTLLPLLSQDRFKTLIQGDGYVKSQSVKPGTKISDGMTLVLNLE